jgi:hypothetical protein
MMGGTGQAIALPWQPVCSPLAGELEAAGAPAILDSRVAPPSVLRALHADMSRAAAWILPEAPLPVLLACQAWLVWFVRFDDAVEVAGGDLPRAAEAAWQALRTGVASRQASPMERLALEVRRRLLAIAGARAARFLAAVDEYVREGALPAAAWRASRRLPERKVFEAFRTRDIGALPLFALMEIALASDPAVATSATATRARELGARIVATCNDLVSRAAEERRGDRLNLVAVLQAEGRTPSEALHAARADLDAAAGALRALRERAERDRSPERGYLWGLVLAVAGCVEAQSGLSRYRTA